MAAYTPSLRLTLPVTGTDDGTWGDTVNNGITSLTDASIAGTALVAQGDVANYTLTNNSGATDQARNMFLNITGALTAARNVVCPAVSKLYFIKNSTTGGFAVTLKTSGGTGISVPAGSITALYCDGTNVVDAITYANIPVINATTVDTTNLEVTNIKAKDGTASITLADSTGVATINAAPILTALTASQAVFTNGSKALVSNAITGTGNVVMSTSATLVTPVLGTPQSGNLINATGLPILSGTTGTLTVARGGTGVTTSTGSTNVVLSNSPTLVTPALGTPSSGVVTNLTGTASININGTVGATTANTGAFTTLTASGTTTLSGNQIISVTDNTNAALRITQLGTGNALLVEDSANPDATPFVIDASGNVFKGYTSSISVEFPMGFQINGTGADAGYSQTRWSNSVAAPPLYLAKSRGSAVATRGIVQSGDSFGLLQFAGDDGTNFIVGAQISGAVDGTPGTNDMPGRLVFSTTADGASSLIERMRINSSGNVGIGAGINQGDSNLTVNKNLTGATTAYGIRSLGTIQTGVTANAISFQSQLSTVASAFTLSSLQHYAATQGTIGLNSVVTNQYGFVADSTLIGATNNYGFFGNIASGTGRFNFYAAGTASNFFAGNTIVSVTDNTNAALRITQLGTGNALLVEDSTNPDATPFVIDASGRAVLGYTNAVLGSQLENYGVTDNLRFSADATGQSVRFFKSRSATPATPWATTVNSGDVLGVFDFYGADGTNPILGARITANVDGTPGTNDMPGRLVFSTTADGASSPTERMRIDSAGSVGIGSAPIAGQTLYLVKNITGSVNGTAIRQQGVVQSDVTNTTFAFDNVLLTAAAAFTLQNYTHYNAQQATIGAGSTVTTQIGFTAGSSLIGATNNYGFYGSIPAGTGRYNFYAVGTAANYFAGNVGIGTTAFNNPLTVSATSAGATSYLARFQNIGTTASTAAGLLLTTRDAAASGISSAITSVTTSNTPGSGATALTFSTTTGGALAEKMRLDASGNLGIGTTSPSTYVSNGGLAIVGLFGTSSKAMTIYNNSAANASNIARIDFKLNNTFSSLSTSAAIYGMNPNAAGNNGGALVFATSSNGTDTNPSEAMRIDSSGNLGLGVTPSAWDANNKVLQVSTSSMAANTSGVSFSQNAYYNAGWKYIATSTASQYDQFQGQHRWFNAPSGTAGNAITFTQAMTLDASGNLLVGTTSIIDGRLSVLAHPGNSGCLATSNNGLATYYPAYFYHNGGLKGYITTDSTATSYVTSSDYRLKNTIAPMTGALDKVALLKPCTYKWNVDGSDGQGFLAHELQEVVEGCVTGEKDAVDAEGKPQYQGIDTSFLVATLTAAIQEQQAMIEELKTRLAAAGI